LGRQIKIALASWATVALLSVLAMVRAVGAESCPQRSLIGKQRVVIFSDGSVAMRTKLAVNPDGALASYTVGDHGFTYIANGLDIWREGHVISCRSKGEHCSTKFFAAEAQSFGVGTQEFCVFAMEVQAMAGLRPTACSKGRVVGNGKGMPKVGPPLITVTGESITPYISTTALTHRVNGVQVYVDSAEVPSMVGPKDRTSDLGRVAWVRSREFSRDAFAVIGDVGNAFGEGSIALHQLLRYGALNDQKPGPIAPPHRCRGSELKLEKPFVSRPNEKNDACVEGRQPRGATDIRAYGEIETVDSIFLGAAAFQRKGNAIDEELSAEVIKAKATAAGYTKERLELMERCLEE
jgi:hypothetical protein